MSLEHECQQKEIIEKLISDLGEIKGIVSQIPQQYERLDRRINGTFVDINEHIRGANDWRSRIIVLETAIVNMRESMLDFCKNVEKNFLSIKEEKLNTTKASQWRIALIVSTVVGVLSNIDKIIKLFVR